MALKGGKPFLSFAVQGGDTQDQNLLQFFLNVVEFGMNVQQAAEAANFNTNQLWLSLGGTKVDDRKPRRPHAVYPASSRRQRAEEGPEAMLYRASWMRASNASGVPSRRFPPKTVDLRAQKA